MPVHGGNGSAGTTDVVARRNYMRYSGTVYVTTFVVSAAPGVGKSYIVDVMLNGVSAATGTISGAATSVAINTNFAVVAGDYIAYRMTVVSTPASVQARIGVYLDDGGSSRMIFCAGQISSLGTATRFIPLCGEQSISATETNHGYFDAPGNVTEIAIVLDTAPGGITSRTFEVYVNGVGSGLLVTITGAGTSGATAGTIAIAQNDKVSVRATATGATATTGYASSVTFTASTEGAAQFIGCNVTAATAAQNIGPNCSTAWGAILGNTVAYGSDITSHSIWRDVAPGAGKTITCTLMLNEVSTGITVAITGGAQTTANTVSTQTLAVDDRIRWDCAYTAGTASGILKITSSGVAFSAATGGSACLV